MGYPENVTDDLADLPLADADRIARERIEAARTAMSHWRKVRATRLITERASGKRVEEIAAEIGLSGATVYEVMSAGKKPRKADKPAS